MAEQKKGHIRGTIHYLQRMALADDAQVAVRLMAVALKERAINEIGSQEYENAGRQVPLPFDIAFEMDQMDADWQYAIEARIEDGKGNLLFKNAGMQFIDLQQAMTEEISIRVEPVR